MRFISCKNNASEYCYCEKAKDKMEQGWSFQKALDSWKTKKHFRELKKIQSEFETIVKKKWWKAHLNAIKKLFLSKQLFTFLGVVALMIVTYHFGYGSVFSILAFLAAILIYCAMIYLWWFKRFKWFFEGRDLTVPFMGSWFIITKFPWNASFNSILTEPFFEYSMVILTAALICGFVGYNLISTAYEELKMITDEYIREPAKFQQR